MKVYKGHKDHAYGGQIVFVTSDDEAVRPHELVNVGEHSLDGFNWGYAGSGPADLAFSILADFLETREIAPAVYQMFKNDFISKADDELRITGDQILDWLANRVWNKLSEEDERA